MELDSFRDQLRLRICGSLNAAEASFDVREQDPWLASVVALAKDDASTEAEADRMLAQLVPQLREDPDPEGLVELLSYCVHVLDLPLVLARVGEVRGEAKAELARGESLRPWDHARLCERVLEAADPGWEDRDMFPSLDR